MDSPALNEVAITAVVAAVLATFILYRVAAHSIRLRRSRASLAAREAALHALAQTSFSAAMVLRMRQADADKAAAAARTPASSPPRKAPADVLERLAEISPGERPPRIRATPAPDRRDWDWAHLDAPASGSHPRHRSRGAAWGFCRTCGAPLSPKRICEMPDCAAAWRAGERERGRLS
jgi:hypothetical protein